MRRKPIDQEQRHRIAKLTGIATHLGQPLRRADGAQLKRVFFLCRYPLDRRFAVGDR
jgi:hypothetical protein